MTQRTRRLLLLALPAAGLALGLVALLPGTSPSAITLENAGKIRVGMTLAEVEALLGGPQRNETDHFIDITRRADSKCWASSHIIVIVELDEGGRVTRHDEFPPRRGRFLATLQHWLGL